MTETELAITYLTELRNITDSDINNQVSMYEVGALIGLEKDKAAMIAEDLIVDGLAELVSLSGNISITQAGLKQLGHVQDVDDNADEVFTLGGDRYLSDDSCRRLYNCISRYRAVVETAALSYEILEEIVLDIKTLEVQLISPRPKTLVVREILKVLADSALSFEAKALHDEILTILGE